MKNLYDVINDAMNKFDFNNWINDEADIIEPALKQLGYTNIRFFTKERDSFGPLSRIVTALDKNGDTVKFYQWSIC